METTNKLTKEENELFYSFYSSLNSLKGTERLKTVYRFFNHYIIKNDLEMVVKFANILMLESNDVSVLRILLDVLKKVNDQGIVVNAYNRLVNVIESKIQSKIY